MPRRLSTLLFALFLCFSSASLVAAKSGIIEVHSAPSGCNVYLDGIFVGKTPYSNPEITIGEHQISVSQEDGQLTQTWDLEIDELIPKIRWFYFEPEASPHFSGIVEESILEQDEGSIQLASIPTGAMVSISGEERYTTPLSYRDVNVGQYQVSFQLNGQTLSGAFHIEKDETCKLIADFQRMVIVNKRHDEKSKLERKQKAAQKRVERQQKILLAEQQGERLRSLQKQEETRVLAARDQTYVIDPIARMYKTNRTYFYSALNLDPDVVNYYKLPYDKITLEIKNLKKNSSVLQGKYYEGDYIFRYGKHIRRGKLNSSTHASCKFTLYNDTVIKLRYDPDDYTNGKGRGKVFASVRHAN